jgi:hypothetical protein
MIKPTVVLVIFVSGKIVLTGAKVCSFPLFVLSHIRCSTCAHRTPDETRPAPARVASSYPNYSVDVDADPDLPVMRVRVRAHRRHGHGRAGRGVEM